MSIYIFVVYFLLKQMFFLLDNREIATTIFVFLITMFTDQKYFLKKRSHMLFSVGVDQFQSSWPPPTPKKTDGRKKVQQVVS